jgi:BlaI family penicillinase repressor
MRFPAVSDAELAVLQLLWDQGRLTTRQITEQLYPKQSGSDLATVQKLVQRLENKKLVGRDRSLFVHTIIARIDRNAFAAQRLAETAAKLTSGSLKPLLAHLVESDQLSPDELDELRKLIDKHRKHRQ